MTEFLPWPISIFYTVFFTLKKIHILPTFKLDAL